VARGLPASAPLDAGNEPVELVVLNSAVAGTLCHRATLITTAASPSSALIAEPALPVQGHLGRHDVFIEADGRGPA
jgi:hypothetical protein